MLDYLRPLIQKNGTIPFVEFMHHALYAPHVGYYNTDRMQLGTAGDFVTAPELTPLFGATLAHQCQEILAHQMNPVILEFGAGTGRLCIDLLKRLEHLKCLPLEYHILEVSPSLKAKQKELILKEIPTLAHRVQWLSGWPEKPFTGLILANEVLDAMPVHRFLKTETGIFESRIGFNEKNTLQETFEPSTHTRLNSHVAKILHHIHTPYCSEANLFIDGWLKQCYAALHQGAMILIDYGFPEHEYYHPDRHMGTLMCHHQQQTHAHVLKNPGQEDITAHVDFTHVAEAAHDAGFHVAGYTNQASFLIANDLLNLLAEITDERARLNAQQAIKLLTHPSEMGELFKVMMLTKEIKFPLRGFQYHDKRASL